MSRVIARISDIYFDFSYNFCEEIFENIRNHTQEIVNHELNVHWKRYLSMKSKISAKTYIHIRHKKEIRYNKGSVDTAQNENSHFTQAMQCNNEIQPINIISSMSCIIYFRSNDFAAYLLMKYQFPRRRQNVPLYM